MSKKLLEIAEIDISRRRKNFREGGSFALRKLGSYQGMRTIMNRIGRPLVLFRCDCGSSLTLKFSRRLFDRLEAAGKCICEELQHGDLMVTDKE